MCLEDRLLVALYNQQGPVPLSELSNAVFITHNAALSIVHRVAASFPHYIILENAETEHNVTLAANTDAVAEVKQFIDGGGFTAINEQEFLVYYKKELQREKLRAFFSKVKSAMTWKRWLAGTGITLASGMTLLAFMRTLKK